MEPHSEVVSNHLSDHNLGNVPDGDQTAEKNGNTTVLPGKDKENNPLDCELSLLDESVDEQNKAPMEILAEFLSALMSREYKTALGYCQQILQYEPSNKTALEFYPLIQQKIKLETEQNKSAEYSSEEESGGSASVEENENKGSESSEYYSSAESGSENSSTHSVSSSEDEDSSCPAVSE